MLTDLIHLNQFTFDFYVQLNIMEWLYFTLPIIRCLFSNVLYDSYIYKFDAFYFKIMDKSYLIVVLMFLNGLFIWDAFKIPYCSFDY